VSAEVLDEQRRAWIAAHAGIFLFQKRRAELLGKRIRARDRDRIGVRPDPHDDQVTAPLAFRTASTATGALESALVAAVAIAAPLGWPLGRALYGWITWLIPDRLRAYPIPALLWTAVACGLPLPGLFDPEPNLSSAVVTPWVLAQIPAAFLAAAGYGVVEGWLAVDGSTDWWPMTPLAPDVDDDLILGPGDVAMPTVLDPTPQPVEQVPIARRRTPPQIHWLPMLSGATAAWVGIVWYCGVVLVGLASKPVVAIAS